VEAAAFHIQDEIFAHYSEADQADITGAHEVLVVDSWIAKGAGAYRQMSRQGNGVSAASFSSSGVIAFILGPNAERRGRRKFASIMDSPAALG
jgi:hypothetical protein